MKSSTSAEIAATELVFTSDLAAQEAATKEVTQALRRKEAMIARRDDKLMDAGALLKETECEAERGGHDPAHAGGRAELSHTLVAKEDELASKDAELRALEGGGGGGHRLAARRRA